MEEKNKRKEHQHCAHYASQFWKHWFIVLGIQFTAQFVSSGFCNGLIDLLLNSNLLLPPVFLSISKTSGVLKPTLFIHSSAQKELFHLLSCNAGNNWILIAKIKSTFLEYFFPEYGSWEHCFYIKLFSLVNAL